MEFFCTLFLALKSKTKVHIYFWSSFLNASFRYQVSRVLQ